MCTYSVNHLNNKRKTTWSLFLPIAQQYMWQMKLTYVTRISSVRAIFSPHLTQNHYQSAFRKRFRKQFWNFCLWYFWIVIRKKNISLRPLIFMFIKCKSSNYKSVWMADLVTVTGNGFIAFLTFSILSALSYLSQITFIIIQIIIIYFGNSVIFGMIATLIE